MDLTQPYQAFQPIDVKMSMYRPSGLVLAALNLYISLTVGHCSIDVMFNWCAIKAEVSVCICVQGKVRFDVAKVFSLQTPSTVATNQSTAINCH